MMAGASGCGKKALAVYDIVPTDRWCSTFGDMQHMLLNVVGSGGHLAALTECLGLLSVAY